MWVSAVHTIFEVAPNGTFAEIHICWTWWLGPPTPKALDRLWLPDKHIMSMVTFTVYRHAPSCWENALSTCPACCMTRMSPFCSCCRYDWFAMVSFTKISPVSPCLLIAHHSAFCRMEWHLHDIVYIFKGPESCVLLVYKPIDVEMLSLNHMQSNVGYYWTIYKMSKTELMFVLLVGCSDYLYDLNCVRTEHQVLLHGDVW